MRLLLVGISELLSINTIETKVNNPMILTTYLFEFEHFLYWVAE